MAAVRFVSYYRVSTKRQGRSGLGLEAQQAAVRSYLSGGRWSLVAEVTEIETGTNKRIRPKLVEALQLCRVHGAALVIAKLDRLSRNVHFISSLMEAGVEFVACDMPSANRTTLQLMSVLAEAEAEAISTRTKAALAAAKARGAKLGGDRGNLDAKTVRKGNRNSAIARREQAQKWAADRLPIIEAIQGCGVVPLRQIAAVLNERGITTVRGGAWSAVQVQRVLRHSSASTTIIR
jgi:DNA invertase Pin-like site-specific DNA recombinase